MRFYRVNGVCKPCVEKNITVPGWQGECQAVRQVVGPCPRAGINFVRFSGLIDLIPVTALRNRESRYIDSVGIGELRASGFNIGHKKRGYGYNIGIKDICKSGICSPGRADDIALASIARAILNNSSCSLVYGPVTD